MIAGTQPGYLRAMLPEVAWDQGFMSRFIMIYSGNKLVKSLFDEVTIDTEDLGKDLLDMRRVYGQFEFSDARPKVHRLLA